jgi:hypothetical protein
MANFDPTFLSCMTDAEAHQLMVGSYVIEP